MGIDRTQAARDLCLVVLEISDRGWCLGTGGNFSVTLSHEPLRLLITPSGANKRHLAPTEPPRRSSGQAEGE